MYVHFRYFRLLLRDEKPFETLDLPPVSILIAARNEAHNLPKLLLALENQDYPQDKFEIILVNDRSRDTTQAVAQAHQARLHNLTTINIESVPTGINPKKNALQIAINQSKFDWLLLTDADCVPPQNWIKSMVCARKNEKTKIVLGISPLVSKVEDSFLATFIQYETFYTALQYAGFARGGKPYMGVGRNLFYHKSLFEQVGGFGEFLNITGGDDDLFINRVATAENTSVASKNGFVISNAPETWSAWYKQKLRHLSVGKHYRRADQMRLGMLYASQGGLWLATFVSLFFLPTLPAWGCLGLCCLRAISVWRDCLILSNRWGCKVKSYSIPIFDTFFVGYLFLVGGIARFTQNIKWKS